MDEDDLRISVEQVCFIVAKARAFHAEVPPSGLEAGSNAVDDEALGALERSRRDPVEAELRSAIAALNVGELDDLLALVMLGREGTENAADWQQIMEEAIEHRPERPVDELIGTPLLADYLEEALNHFGLGCAEAEVEAVPPAV